MLRSGWRTVGTLLVALLGTWQAPALAQTEAASTIAFDISDGTLLGAIKQFSEQTGIQVTADFGQPETQEHPVAALNESLTAEAALERILEGSGLVAKWHTSRTVRIYPVTAPRAFDGVNEVVVTGSRLRGWQDGPAPVRVYTRDDIDRLGVSTLSGVADYFTQQPFSFGEWAQRTGAQHFQMRGLGVDTTLVLINGRRAPPSAMSVTLNAFDLNTIPLTAVERIEVMSDSASAIYGADAIGGVVNIILKKDIEGPDVYAHYGTAAGGGEQRRIGGGIGASGERFKTSIMVDYFDQGMLIGMERDLWKNQDFRRFGGKDYRVTSASPGNVYSLTGEPLPGLPTAQAAVPVGSTGVGLRPEDFLATAGVSNLYSLDELRSIVPDVRRLATYGSAKFALTESSSVFGELLLVNSDVTSQGFLPTLTQQIVPASNPYNPFGQDVAVDLALVGMKPLTIVTQAEFERLVFGAHGALGGWDWEVAFMNSNERVDSERINDVDPTRVAAALASTDLKSALNPFVDGPAATEDVLSSLVGDPQHLDFFSGALQLSGFVRGPLFSMPGGMADFVIGGEWRREKLEASSPAAYRRRDVMSGFAEIKVPLTEELALKLAVRRDSYEGTEDAVNPQYGLVWRPAQDWLVRTTYGTSFRPPSLAEMSSERLEFITSVADPLRGGAVYPVRLIAGGNPDLRNVAAHSFTGGVLYRDDRAWGLHWGVHYWRVVMSNRIFAPRTWGLAELEELMPERVTRSPPSEDDRLAGWSGPIESLDVSVLNFGRLKTDGVDIDLSYGFPLKSGGLRADLSATWVNAYSSQDLSPLKPIDRVGIASFDGTIPKWRLVGGLTWEGYSWGTSATATFTPRYRDADPVSGLLDRYLPSQTIVDVQTWIDLDRVFGSSFFERTKLTAGSLNLFDHDVDFANVGLSFGFDVSQADLKQRFTYIRLTKSF